MCIVRGVDMLENIKSLFKKETKDVVAPKLGKEFIILKQMLYSQLCRCEDYRLRGAMVDYYIEDTSHIITVVFPYIIEGLSVDWKVKNPDYIKKQINKTPYAVAELTAEMIMKEARKQLEESEGE